MRTRLPFSQKEDNVTLNTLYDEVRALGFEDGGAADNAFVFAANRALLQIATDCKEKKRGTVYAAGYPQTLVCALYVHTGGEMTFSLSGKSFCFISNGRGTYTLTDKSGAKEMHFCGVGQINGGNIDGAADITFSGDNAYTVYDLVSYGVTFGKGDPVPYSEKRAYALCDYIPDLLAVCAPATDANGRSIPNATVIGGELLLPVDFCGKVYIDYVKRPKEISIDTPDEPIDIAVHLALLLPLLTASYVWLDDDAEKATYYMSLYRNASTEIRTGLYSSVNSQYLSADGWA